MPATKIDTPAEVANLPAPRARANAVQAIVPANWQEIASIASAICRAGMAPKSYCKVDGNGKLVYVEGKPVAEPDKVAIAIMHGMEVGMTPMASLQSLAVINGMPSLYGDGMLAVVRASGVLEDIIEELEWDNQGPMKATCKVKRKGEPTWGVMECARADAQKAGWWGKPGPWSLTPHRMMQMRARGWALRDKFADVLRGLHSAEEAQDMVDITPQGSVTHLPMEPEPKRSDFEPKKDEPSTGAKAAKTAKPRNKTSPPASALPPDGGQQDGKSGQADVRTSAAGEASSPAGQPATGKPPHDEQASAEATKREQLEAAGVTDVVDQNATPAKIEFQNFETARDFFLFCEEWLQDPKRTPAEARQWEEFYRSKLKEFAEHKFKRIQEATAEIVGFYSAVLAKEQP